ncbi:MAG: hypothetical protein OHK0017_08500 [Patescibacteria group bacterium]
MPTQLKTGAPAQSEKGDKILSGIFDFATNQALNILNFFTGDIAKAKLIKEELVKKGVDRNQVSRCTQLYLQFPTDNVDKMIAFHHYWLENKDELKSLFTDPQNGLSDFTKAFNHWENESQKAAERQILKQRLEQTQAKVRQLEQQREDQEERQMEFLGDFEKQNLSSDEIVKALSLVTLDDNRLAKDFSHHFTTYRVARNSALGLSSKIRDYCAKYETTQIKANQVLRLLEKQVMEYFKNQSSSVYTSDTKIQSKIGHTPDIRSQRVEPSEVKAGAYKIADLVSKSMQTFVPNGFNLDIKLNFSSSNAFIQIPDGVHASYTSNPTGSNFQASLDNYKPRS